jgi:CBS domain-containing protein
MALDSYETACVASIAPGATLRAAAQTMEKHRVGLLIVEDAEQLRGVISDRDIAFAVVAGKRHAESSLVQEVMTRQPATVAADARLRDAVEAMRLHGVRRLPVTDGDDRVKGVVAVDDLLRLFAAELGGLAAVAAGQSRTIPTGDTRPGGAKPRGAAEHYLKDVLCASREASVEQVCAEMKKRAFGCAVIVDATGIAVGLLTDRDIVLRVIAPGLDPSVTTAGAVMSSPVAVVEPSAPIEDVIEVMRACAARRVPVVRDGRPVGLVSYDDLVVCLGEELHALGAALARGRRGEQLARSIESVREQAGARLDEVASQLGQIGDQALARIGNELEALRERLCRMQN